MKQIIKQAIDSVGRCIPISTNLSADEARRTLQTFSPKPIGTCYTSNVVNTQYDLQIIIPCYNVEKWVKQCLESVMKQRTKYNVLISIVNDGSTDGTEKVIREVIEGCTGAPCTSNPYSSESIKQCTNSIEQWHYRHDSVGGGYTIELKTQENRGLSGARNAALKQIQGTYISFLDSDDVLADGAIDRMLDAAYQYDAEILQGSWYEFAENTVTVGHTANIADEMSEANPISPVETSYKMKMGEHIISKEGVLDDNRGVFSGFPWGKLYKYNVLEHFQFPEGFWFEDTPVSFMLAALPYRCAAIKDVVYGYRSNPEGITRTSGRMKRSVESYWITEACLEEFPAFGLSYDQRAYEYLLRQSVMNEGRVRHQPMAIRKAIFVLTAELMEKYFSGFQTNVENMKWIEDALRKRQFIRFDLGTIGR